MKTEVKGFFKNRRTPPGKGSFLLVARGLSYGQTDVFIAGNLDCIGTLDVIQKGEVVGGGGIK
jgi:hypothetical protein